MTTALCERVRRTVDDQAGTGPETVPAARIKGRLSGIPGITPVAVERALEALVDDGVLVVELGGFHLAPE